MYEEVKEQILFNCKKFNYSAKQTEFVLALEDLMFERHSEESLTKKLREITDVPTLKINMNGDPTSIEYDAMFNIFEDENKELAGYFDVYYCKMNETACKNCGIKERFVVTGVGYEFDNC